ncbi:MAG: hypothetical protein ACYTEX_06410 [Planctomycetota bacterium]|jgi:tetratricopeptide (TPR) repeat protein
MIKYKPRSIILAAVLAIGAFSTVWAETWYLEQGRDWKLLSAESKDAFLKANALAGQRKLVRAVKAYDQFLAECDPNSELYTEALTRQFAIAKKFLAGRKKRVLGIFKVKGYAEGVRIMERISRRAGEATIGVDAAFEIARHYEQRGKSKKTYFELAYLKWLEIFETYDRDLTMSTPWPTGVVGKDSLLGMARCKHAAYRGDRYDGSGLENRRPGENSPYDTARDCYEQFMSLYPQDAQEFAVDGELQEIDKKLARKDLAVGKYYQRIGNLRAANLYYQMVIRDWKGTAAENAARKLLAENLEGRRDKKK